MAQEDSDSTFCFYIGTFGDLEQQKAIRNGLPKKHDMSNPIFKNPDRHTMISFNNHCFVIVVTLNECDSGSIPSPGSVPDKRVVSGQKPENAGFLTQQNDW